VERFELGEDARLLRPLQETGRGFWIFTGALFLIWDLDLGDSAPGERRVAPLHHALG
jgi:hypothetical protein